MSCDVAKYVAVVTAPVPVCYAQAVVQYRILGDATLFFLEAGDAYLEAAQMAWDRFEEYHRVHGMRIFWDAAVKIHRRHSFEVAEPVLFRKYIS